MAARAAYNHNTAMAPSCHAVLAMLLLLQPGFWTRQLTTAQDEESHYTLVYQDPSDCLPDPEATLVTRHEFFNSSRMECQACPQNSTYHVTSDDGLTCECTPTTHLEQYRPDDTVIRARCALCQENEISSLDGWDCVTCGTGTVNPNQECSTCELPDRIIADRELLGQPIAPENGTQTVACIVCQNVTQPGPQSERCLRCSQVLSVQTGDCDCPPERQTGGLCFAEETDIVDTPSYIIDYDGQLITSVYLEDHLAAAHGACVYYEDANPDKMGYGNLTACQLLGNLCVTSLYVGDGDSACELHRDLALGDGSTWPTQPAGVNGINEWALNMPWLYYADTTEAYLYDKGITTKFHPYDIMPLKLAKYSVEGDYEGLVDASSGEIQLCDDEIQNLDVAYTFGVNYYKKCSLSVRDLYDSEEFATYFYDMYLEFSDGVDDLLYPIPLRIRNYQNNGDKNEENWELLRRFFLVERFAGYNALSDEPRPNLIRYISDLVIHIPLQEHMGNGLIYPPYLEITYSTATSNDYDNDNWVETEFEVVYSMPLSSHKRDLSIAMGVMSGLALIYAFFLTVNVNRRDGKIAIDLMTIVKFLFLLCGCLADVFFVVIFGFTLWWFIVYKEQDVMALVPDDGAITDIKAYLGSAFGLKCIEIIYIIGSQVTCNLFFVDWERPHHAAPATGMTNMPRVALMNITQSGDRAPQNVQKQQLATESVSIWRTYFVANEWNEIQTIRRIRPVVQLLLVIMVLYSIGMEHWAHYDPSTSSSDEDKRGEYTDIFRFPVLVLSYIIVGLAMWLFRLLIWSRFVDDPLGNFIDLCSMCNVSVFVMTHRQYGHYIHGRSAHGKADVNLKAMHEFLIREESGTCSDRGLVPGCDEQTFETIVPSKFRDEMEREQFFANASPPPATQRGGGALNRFTSMEGDKRVDAYNRLNKFVQSYIDHNLINLSYTIKVKTWWEKLLRTEFVSEEKPPDVGYFYSGVGMSFTKSILYGEEMPLQIYILLFFTVMDMWTQDYVFAAILAYILDAFTVWVRNTLGERNITNKTMIDKRFLI